MESGIQSETIILTALILHLAILAVLVQNQNDIYQAAGLLLTPGLKRHGIAKKRRFWMLQRSTDWWDTIVKNFDDSDWLHHFRIRKSTFDQLVSILGEDLKPDDRSVRSPIPLEKRIAVALYKLASAAEFRVVGVAFGIHKTSVHRCLHRFCKALCKRHRQFIYLPDSNEAQLIANQNHQKSGFPQVFGAIDGCHIHVKPPKIGMRDYINRKRFPSLVLQAVVDNQYRFRDISVKMPGSVHDASVLRASHLFKSSDTLPKSTITINNAQIPLMIVGDSAYPMLPWLMRPYTGSTLNEKQERFNYHHSSVRIVVENAFGRLKARWRILKRQLDVDIKESPFVIAACCIMHNMCEESQTPVPRDAEITLTYGSSAQPDAAVDSHIRSTIADYLFGM